MTTAFETEVCSRCGGTGHFSFNGEHSRCYKCDNKNGARAYTKRGAAAKAYYLAKFQVPAEEIKIGDKIRDTQQRIQQLTVAKIERSVSTARVWISGVEQPKFEQVTFTNEVGLSVSYRVDSLVRRIPTAEENEAAIADALRYRETLTKEGKPRRR